MKKLFPILLLLVFSLQPVSGIETDLYAVIKDPSVYYDYYWSGNDTRFTMRVDYDIINPNENDLNITFGDTCGFKPKVEADFYSDAIEFASFLGQNCGFAFREISYEPGNTSESKLLDFVFYGRNITKLLEGKYTFYLDHPNISVSHNTTMIVGLYDTIFIHHDEEIRIDTSRLTIKYETILIGFLLISKFRKSSKCEFYFTLEKA